MNYEVGQALAVLTRSAKQAAAKPSISYGMVGELQLSQSGWLLLTVPNAIVRGAFAALTEPGVELPPSGPGGRLDAHISVMSPDEVAQLGGANKITERGRDFSYTLGPVRTTVPAGWPGMSKVWMIAVESPPLKKLRTSYGLPPLPTYPFHCTIAVRRKGVLYENETSKAAASRASNSGGAANASLIYGGDLTAFFKSPPNKAGRRCPGCGKPFKKIEPYPDVKNCEACERFGATKKVAHSVTPMIRRQQQYNREVWICPHCNDEIGEKALYIDPEGYEWHRSCDAGPIGRTKTAVSTKQRLATERRKVEEPASEEQAAAGNYRKGHIRLHGLDISIENGKGSTRSGTSPDGRSWSIRLRHDYGYIRNSDGADGDHVDVFVGESPDTELVFCVNQIDPATGKFDEHKVLLGFNTQEEAESAYLSNYEAGWKGMGSVVVFTIPQFKTWLKGDTTTPAKLLLKEGQGSESTEDITEFLRAFLPKAGLALDARVEKRAEDDNRPPVIAVDLDGTILEYDGWKGEDHFGKPRVGAKKALKELQRRGYLVVINTCRGNEQAVKDVLHEHDLPYDYVNSSPYQPPGTSDKIQADVYIDDRAVNAKQPWSRIIKETIRRVKVSEEQQNAIRNPFQAAGSFYLAAVPATPLAYNPAIGPVQNLVRHLGAVRQRGDQAIRETYAQEDLANAADPARRTRQFSAYLAGQRKPTVHHLLDRIIQGAV